MVMGQNPKNAAKPHTNTFRKENTSLRSSARTRVEQFTVMDRNSEKSRTMIRPLRATMRGSNENFGKPKPEPRRKSM
jgi:hypothetical protein